MNKRPTVAALKSFVLSGGALLTLGRVSLPSTGITVGEQECGPVPLI